jgi:hypothetical protein
MPDRAQPRRRDGLVLAPRDLPDLPHAGHLAPVLAQHEFQEAFKNYRDLLFLTKNLEEWHEKLGVFDDMLDDAPQGLRRPPAAGARARQRDRAGCAAPAPRPGSPPKSPPARRRPTASRLQTRSRSNCWRW